VNQRVQLAASVVLFGVLPLVFLGSRFGVDPHHLVDFRNLWHAGQDIIAGRSPYHSPVSPTLPLTADCSLSGPDCFVYPPPAAFLAAPLGLLPFAAAGAIWFLLETAAVLLALRVSGLTDWRCYGIAIGSAPTLSAIEGGALTPLLALGLAIAWRYRERRLVAAAAVAAVIVLKIFLWPLLIWLVATRRSMTALTAVALATVATIVSWAAIGFSGLTEYPRLLSSLNEVWRWRGYTPSALGVAAGLPSQLATALGLLIGVAALGIATLVARQGNGDLRAFAVVLAAALLLSPVVWLHYFALLLIPLAIARPRLGPAWALPLALIVLPGAADGRAGVIALGLTLSIAISAVAARPLRSVAGIPVPA
jgi:glycosyl transferase family 87